MVFVVIWQFQKFYLLKICKKLLFDMIFLKRNFRARGWSVVGTNGIQPESRRFRLSNGGSLEPNDPQNNEKLTSENGPFLD
jgi:hypothetical protein